MANDPVLQRSMFQKQAPAAPSVAPSVGLGIGSVTTPDQNAQAMRSLFQPTVSMSMPMQEPVQSFQEGGLAKSLIAQYDWRNQRYQNPPSYAERTSPEYMQMQEARRRQAIDDADAIDRTPPAPKSQFRRDVGSIFPTEGQALQNLDALARGTAAQRKALEDADRARSEAIANSPGSAVGDYFRDLTPEEAKARAEARAAATEKLRSEGATIAETYTRDMGAVTAPARGIPSLDVARMLDRDRAEEPRMPVSAADRQPPPPPAAEAPARQKGTLELTLDGIKAERAAERRENALLALMQAGFAMAAGRSPNALSNIGAGGQAGIGAFAAMERASREDAASRRREAIQLDLANRQLEKDPEAVRTYALLGGWTPDQGRDKLVESAKRGFDFMQTKEAPARAEALLKAAAADPLRGTPGALISPEEARRLSQFLYGSITSTLTQRGERSGQPSGPQTFKLDELPRSK